MSSEEMRSREGLRAWLGVLDAFKEAIDETIEEIRQRGAPSPERAREAMRRTMQRAQSAMGEARERLDFVPRRDFEALREEVAELRRRVAELAGRSRPIPVEGACAGRFGRCRGAPWWPGSGRNAWVGPCPGTSTGIGPPGSPG